MGTVFAREPGDRQLFCEERAEFEKKKKRKFVIVGRIERSCFLGKCLLRHFIVKFVQLI